MDSEDNSEDHRDSDEGIDDATHAKLVRNVLSLNSKQFVKRPSRTEPTVNISEYDLAKSGKNLQLLELARALKGRGRKHVEIEKKIRKVGKRGKTLPKPLEKPQADRIRRTVGYQKATAELDRWEPVVTSMRAAPQIKFPLQKKVNLTEEPGESKWRMKSDLERELEEIQPKIEVIEVETEKKFPMTVGEMMERRREAAKLRAYQSYKEAKARRQNKIKSKKYHRIQKRERVKQQLKEFELLQKTDPQAALEKLDEIERARALERVSLRHKGTGKWAKNKQIRAKYDKESRQVLAQQLAISRDLTQKQKLNGSDSEYEEKENEDAVRIDSNNSSNPWVNGADIKVAKEVDDFVSGYRKYWEEMNGNKEGESEGNINGNAEGSEDVSVNGKLLRKKSQGDTNKNKKVTTNGDLEESDDEKDCLKKNVKEKRLEKTTNKNKTSREESERNMDLAKSNSKVTPSNRVGKKKPLKTSNAEKVSNDGEAKTRKHLDDNAKTLLEHERNITVAKVKIRKEKQLKNSNAGKVNKQKQSIDRVAKTKHPDEDAKTTPGTSEWEVIDVDKELTKSDTKLQKHLQERYDRLKKELAIADHKPPKKKKKATKRAPSKPDLTIPVKPTRPIIDEELRETTSKDPTNDVTQLKLILDDRMEAEEEDIDPDKFMRVKKPTTELDTEIPDLVDFDDNEEDEGQKDVITEAFEDDDIAESFRKEKKDEVNKDKVGNVDLALPGWGSWGGKDIKVPTRKRRRFMMKFPKKMPRKDKNKGDLIIKEGNSAKLKAHLVSEVPFPFKSVKDYEASIRAPIGNTFVPEIAHRKMIRPAVVSKMGAIIEPMTEDVLLKKKKW